MDIFVEQLVKKKRTPGDYARIVACIIGALLVLLLLPLSLAVQGIGFIVFAVCCGLIYLLYMLITATNLEYEYCFTNGALDVDKIVNVRSRKRLADVNAREIEMMASNKNRTFRKSMDDAGLKKIKACSHPDDEGVFFVIYQGKEGRTMLLFNPNEKIQDGFKRYNPQKVFLDD